MRSPTTLTGPVASPGNREGEIELELRDVLRVEVRTRRITRIGEIATKIRPIVRSDGRELRGPATEVGFGIGLDCGSAPVK